MEREKSLEVFLIEPRLEREAPESSDGYRLVSFSGVWCHLQLVSKVRSINNVKPLTHFAFPLHSFCLVLRSVADTDK